jgi:hypothetical protein
MDKNLECFEYCLLCDKVYNLKSRKVHLKSKKHQKLLMQHNLTNSDIEICRYNLIEIPENENKQDDIMYLPVD